MSSTPLATGGKQLARASSHATRSQTQAQQPEAPAVSNSEVQEQVAGEEADGGYLDALMGAADSAIDAVGDWWSSDDTSSVGPFATETPDLLQQLVGNPASSFSSSETPSLVQGPTSDDSDQQLEPSSASEVRHGLADGVASRQQTYQLGPLTIGYSASPTEGQLSGIVDFDAGPLKLHTAGGIDFTDNGALIEGATGVMGAEMGPASASMSGGYRDTVTDVAEKDGMFEVTVIRGAGGKASIGGKGSDGNELGLERSGSGAETLTRVFHTREDAEAFQTSASLDPAANQASAVSMKPGEKMVLRGSQQEGGSVGGAYGVAAGAGLEEQKDRSASYEMGEDQVLTVTRSAERTDSARGQVGAAMASVDGSGAYRFQQNDELTFDLKQPGVVGLLLAYQATGQLPDELPKGIERVGREALSGPVMKHATQAGVVATEGERSLLTGIREENGEVGQVARATWEEKAGYKLPVANAWIDQGSEAHELEALRMPGEAAQVTSRSHYQGRDAIPNAVDDTERYLDLPELQQRYGHQAGDVVVESDFDAAALELLHDRAASGTLENNEIDGSRGFEDLKHALAAGDAPEAIARYVYERGGDGLAALRDNTEGQRQDYLQLKGSELLGQTPDQQRADQAEIAAAIGSGDQERLEVLYAQEQMYREALAVNAEDAPREFVRERADRVGANADSLESAMEGR